MSIGDERATPTPLPGHVNATRYFAAVENHQLPDCSLPLCVGRSDILPPARSMQHAQTHVMHICTHHFHSFVRHDNSIYSLGGRITAAVLSSPRSRPILEVEVPSPAELLAEGQRLLLACIAAGLDLGTVPGLVQGSLGPCPACLDSE